MSAGAAGEIARATKGLSQATAGCGGSCRSALADGVLRTLCGIAKRVSA
jgi:hypothetical protein